MRGCVHRAIFRCNGNRQVCQSLQVNRSPIPTDRSTISCCRSEVLHCIKPPLGFHGNQPVVAVETENCRCHHRHGERKQGHPAGFINCNSGDSRRTILPAVCAARKIVRSYMKQLFDICSRGADGDALMNPLADKMRMEPEPGCEQNGKVNTCGHKRVAYYPVHDHGCSQASAGRRTVARKPCLRATWATEVFLCIRRREDSLQAESKLP
jgi:hypothetical protein